MLTRLKIPEKGGALRLISASLVSNRLFGGEGRPSLKYPPLAFHPGFRPIPVDRRRSRNALLHGYTAKTNQAFGRIESQYLPSIFSPWDTKCNNRRSASGKTNTSSFSLASSPTFCVRAAEFHPPNSTRNSTWQPSLNRPSARILNRFVSL